MVTKLIVSDQELFTLVGVVVPNEFNSRTFPFNKNNSTRYTPPSLGLQHDLINRANSLLAHCPRQT